MLSLCLLAVRAKFVFMGLATATSSRKNRWVKRQKVLLREESPIYRLAEHEGVLKVGSKNAEECPERYSLTHVFFKIH